MISLDNMAIMCLLAEFQDDFKNDAFSQYLEAGIQTTKLFIKLQKLLTKTVSA
jgi:hypothetical protein